MDTLTLINPDSLYPKNIISIGMQIRDKKFELFISEVEIQNKVKELAKQISFDYKDKLPLILPLLDGAFLFAADIVREITIPCELSFIKTKSYQGTESTGTIKNLFGLEKDFEGRHLIIVDDIVDTGFTMSSIVTELQAKSPASISIATLLYKPEALKTPLSLNYVGFEIPKKFVLGYGLDYDGLGRNFKDIYQLSDNA